MRDVTAALALYPELVAVPAGRSHFSLIPKYARQAAIPNSVPNQKRKRHDDKVNKVTFEFVYINRCITRDRIWPFPLQCMYVLCMCASIKNNI